jgi:hypothetical protein
MSDHAPPLCRDCGRRVRFWQRYTGFGPIGFTRKTADVLWREACMRARGGA